MTYDEAITIIQTGLRAAGRDEQGVSKETQEVVAAVVAPCRPAAAGRLLVSHCRAEACAAAGSKYLVVELSDGRTLFASARHLPVISTAELAEKDAWPVVALLRETPCAALADERDHVL